MERKCLHSALPLRSASLLLVGLLAAALAGGCAVQKTIVYEGRAFPVERIVGIDAATGGEIWLVFDAAGRVRQVAWEIAGPEAYRTLAAGTRR